MPAMTPETSQEFVKKIAAYEGILKPD